MRCPDCSKFVSFEEGEPEVESEELDAQEDGSYSVTVEAVFKDLCGECNTELREGRFTLEDGGELPLVEDPEEGQPEHAHVWVLELEDPVRTSRPGAPGRKGRSSTYHGISVDYAITCEGDGCDEGVHGTLKDEVKASHLEELV